MKRVVILIILIVSFGQLFAQEAFRDSVKHAWKAKFKRIIKVKERTDSSHVAYLFDKKSHELLAVSSSERGSMVPFNNAITYYFANNELLYFKVMIVHQDPKVKGYVEYYYSNDQLIDKVEMGRVISNYRYLKANADGILRRSAAVLYAKLSKRKNRER